MQQASQQDVPANQPKSLRYEFARLATLRNLFIAVIGAAAVVAFVWVVALNQHPAAPVPEQPPAANGAPPTTPAVQPARPELIPPTPAILAKLPKDTAPDLISHGSPSENRQTSGLDSRAIWSHPYKWADYADPGVRAVQTDENGDSWEQCPSIEVESGPGWSHTVSYSFDGKHRWHNYTFATACGHPVLTTPDPYRDLMFAHPEEVAAQYKAELCQSCATARNYLDRKNKQQGGGA